MVNSIAPALHDIRIWESKASIFIIGRSQNEIDSNVVLEITRPKANSSKVLMKEHDSPLRSHEINTYLEQHHKHPLTCTIDNAKCLYGFIRLQESSYLLVVLDAIVVASVEGHLIHQATRISAPISISYKPRETIEESRYKNLLGTIDFTQGFYFSFTFDLTHTMQQQHQQRTGSEANGDNKSEIVTNDAFVWNYFALKPLFQLSNSCWSNWVVPIIHGYVNQKEITLPLSSPSSPSTNQVEDRVLLCLIARRSRHFSGVRYLRRGADCEGSVANHVETEQIVTHMRFAANNVTVRCSSSVQVRGSVPLFWSHNNYFVPNAPIHIEASLAPSVVGGGGGDGDDGDDAFVSDPDNTSGASEEELLQPLTFIRHMASLQERFGDAVTVLSLVSTIPYSREYALGQAYQQLCEMKPSLSALLHVHGNGNADENGNGSANGRSSVCAGLLKRVHKELLRKCLEEIDPLAQQQQQQVTPATVLFKVVELLDVRNYIPILSRTAAVGDNDCSRDENGNIIAQRELQHLHTPAYTAIIEASELLQQSRARLNELKLTHIGFDLHHQHNHPHKIDANITSSVVVPQQMPTPTKPIISKRGAKNRLINLASPPNSLYVSSPSSMGTPNAEAQNCLQSQVDDGESADQRTTAADGPAAELASPPPATTASAQVPAEAVAESGEPEEDEEGFDELITTLDNSSPAAAQAISDVFGQLSLICAQEVRKLGVFVQAPMSTSPSSPTGGEASAITSGATKYLSYTDYLLNALTADSSVDTAVAASHHHNSVGGISNVGILQTGVFRTNCVDCLDRTNIGQFCFAKEALKLQLDALGLFPSPASSVDLASSLGTDHRIRDALFVCMEMWSDHGDIIARQYAGSGAMHRVDRHPLSYSLQDQAATDASGNLLPLFTIRGGVQNAVVAVQRYASNISSDYDRQQATDLLLGVFQPTKSITWDAASSRPEQMRFDRLRKTRTVQVAMHKRANAKTLEALANADAHVGDPGSIEGGTIPPFEPTPDDCINSSLWVYESDNPFPNAYIGCAHQVVLPASNNSNFSDSSLLKTFSQGSLTSDHSAPSDCSSARLFWTGPRGTDQSSTATESYDLHRNQSPINRARNNIEILSSTAPRINPQHSLNHHDQEEGASSSEASPEANDFGLLKLIRLDWALSWATNK